MEIRLRAERGDAAAQGELGMCYYNGNGVPQNKVEAVKWYRKAAEQGDDIAQCSMGLCYENGDVVDRNIVLAKYWYNKAAEQGLEEAKEALLRIEVKEMYLK